MYEYFRNMSSTDGLSGKEIDEVEAGSVVLYPKVYPLGRRSTFDYEVGLSGNCDSCYDSRQVAQRSKVLIARLEARIDLCCGSSHLDGN